MRTKLFVDGLPEFGERPGMPTEKEAEDAVWKFLKKIAPTFLGRVKETNAVAPNKLTLRLETEAKTAKLNPVQVSGRERHSARSAK